MAADAESKTNRGITINSSKLMAIAKGNSRFQKDHREFLKDTFATALAHEAIHLEVAPLAGKDPRTFLREEERAWRKMAIEIVRPLRAQGRKVLPDFAEADDIMRSCKDRLPCPKLTKFLDGKVRVK
jgi:hypothetical protein